MAETPNAPTRSLRASANPQARMQELLRKEAPALPDEESAPTENSSATALPDSSTTSSAVAQTPSNMDSSQTDKYKEVVETSQAASPPRQTRNTGPEKAKAAPSGAKANDNASHASNTVAQTTSSEVAQITGSATYRATSNNPVHDAMLAMLALPYPPDMEDGQMTVTTVKIPKPLWERLEYARTLTKQDKQDIIAAALRLYFEQIVEGNMK